MYPLFFSHMNPKKYLINVDFFDKSQVHLNPLYYGEMWCQLNEDKKIEAGGKVEVTRKEAIEYLSGKKTLYFNNKSVKNLELCKNCSHRQKQSVYWDIPIE